MLVHGTREYKEVARSNPNLAALLVFSLMTGMDHAVWLSDRIVHEYSDLAYTVGIKVSCSSTTI